MQKFFRTRVIVQWRQLPLSLSIPYRITVFNKKILTLKLTVLPQAETKHSWQISVLPLAWIFPWRWNSKHQNMQQSVDNNTCIAFYTECHRRKGPNFGRVFLMLNYTDITQNTYNQSWTVTEIMAGEKCGHLAFPRSIRLQLYREPPLPVGHLTACRMYVG